MQTIISITSIDDIVVVESKHDGDYIIEKCKSKKFPLYLIFKTTIKLFIRKIKKIDISAEVAEWLEEVARW